MNTKIIAICAGAILGGFLLFAFQYDYLMVRLPQSVMHLPQPHHPHKKKVLFYYWNHHRWHQEQEELFWGEHMKENIQHIINHWLKLMEEHGLLNKSVSAIIAPSLHEQLIYCSFDRTPFCKEWSIVKKWMFIEGMLKTIKAVAPNVQECIFLMRHQPLVDSHLDFSYGWPLSGFTAPQLQ